MAPPRLGVIGKIKDILTGKSPELYSPPGTLRDTQGNIVINPKEALPMGGISPKPSGGGGNNPSQPIQSDNSEAIRIAELERLAEIERQRILQQQQQREAEQQKLNELAQQKRREEFIALGKGAQTEVLTDEFIGGKRVSELKYTIKQMPGETKEAFEFRAAQLGKAGTASLEAKRRLPNETTSQFEARTKPFTREIPTKEFLTQDLTQVNISQQSEQQQILQEKISAKDFIQVKTSFGVPTGIGISPRVLLEAAKKYAPPQQWGITQKTIGAETIEIPLTSITGQKLNIITPAGMISDIETARQKGQVSFKSIGLGVLEDVKESTKAFSEAVIKPIEKQILKIPYETRVKIVGVPKVIGKEIAGGTELLYRISGLKGGVGTIKDIMINVPAPQQWGITQKTIGAETIEIPLTSITGQKLNIITPAGMISDIEKSYLS
jgi:hypothetical protein